MEGHTSAELSRRLTPRQFEVLGLIAQRFSSKEIGRLLGLSPKTVDRHVEEILSRLGLSSRSEAARLFLEHQNDHGEHFPMGIRNVDSVVAHTQDAFQPVEGVHEGNQQVPPVLGLAATLKRITTLPPVGGRRHEMTLGERLATVGQIGLFSLLIIAAMITLITGILHMLDR